MDPPKWTTYFQNENFRGHSAEGFNGIDHYSVANKNRGNRNYTSMPQVSSRNDYPNSQMEHNRYNYSNRSYKEISDFPHVSMNSNQGRALPPTPCEKIHKSKMNYSKSTHHQPSECKIHKRQLPAIPNDNSKNSNAVNKHRKHKRRRGTSDSDAESTHKKCTSKERSDTAVVLTVSIRNANKLKKLRQFSVENAGDPMDTSITIHKKPKVRSMSRESSTDSKCDLVNSKQRSRRRRSTCIIPMVVSTVVILAGLLSGVAFILLHSEDPFSQSAEERGTDMILAKAHMTVLNWKYHDNMTSNLSEEYISFAAPFESQVDELFRKSNYTNYYYGCKVTELRFGSVKTINDLVFEDYVYLRNPSVIENTIKQSSPPYTYEEKKALKLGKFVVDFDSIQVNVRRFNTLTPPTKTGSTGTGRKIQKTDTLLEEEKRRPETHNDIETQDGKSITIPNKKIEGSTVSGVIADPKEFKGTEIPNTVPRSGRKQVKKTEEEAKSSNVNNEHSENPTKSTGVHLETTSAAHGDVTLPVQTSPAQSSHSRSNTSKEFKTNLVVTQSASVGAEDTTHQPEDGNFAYISVNSAVITSSDDAASIRCKLHYLDGWKYVVVEHERPGGVSTVIVNVTSGGHPQFTNLQDIHRIFLDMKSDRITLTFTVKCTDEGKFTCKAYRRGIVYTGEGTLTIKDKPTRPNLTLPIEIVENREITKPITCSANVGYPGGSLRWTMKPAGHNTFYPFPGTTETRSGRCNTLVTSTLVYRPTIQGNGTVLKCEVLNSNFPEEKQLYETSVIKIVPENICSEQDVNTTIRHPYSCSKYVKCFDQTSFTIHECPDELCFDPDTGICGQTGLSLSSAEAYLTEDIASLTCRLLHLGEWYSISISKLFTSGDKSHLLTVYNDTEKPDIPAHLKNHIHTTIQTSRYEVRVTMWLYTLTCQDEGQYTCEVQAPFTIEDAVGTLNLKARPKVPTLLVPTQIIDDRDLRENFVCEGDVGYPGGDLYLEIRYQNESSYSYLPFNDTFSTETANCSTVIRREFLFRPSLEHDKMELRCVATNENTSPPVQLFTSANVYVIPANFCTPGEPDRLPHPYDCTQYVQCTEGDTYVQKCSTGLCFNPGSKNCDLPEPTESVVFDPNFPCKPNRNGVYFPHPITCNKYIWCVQGREVIQDCRLGTLYLGNGQCTFRIDQSHCFRNSTQNVK